LSDFLRGRKLLDWPKDVCELADRFGVFRFTVLGVSGGGPYALACAAAVPDRVQSTLLVSSVGTADSPESLRGMVALHRWLLVLARRAPWLAHRVAGLCMRVFWGRGLQPIPPSVEKRLCARDRLALQSRELRETLITSSLEAFRQGVSGAALDGLLLARPWGFQLEEVQAQVQLWHGEADVVIPPGMGRCLARRLKHCGARFCPEEGHFSLLYHHAAEILRTAAA
jgi:pimeloyl-ACP methyl ester carboxylesterase